MWKPEEGLGSPGTRVREGCEPPFGCWDSNLPPGRAASAQTCKPSLPAELTITLLINRLKLGY